MTILVTGATGFIGSHIAEQLSQGGVHVRCLVRKTSDTRFLKTLAEVELIEGSVEDRESVLRAAEGVDGIVHSAGLVRARNPREFMDVNAGGTRNLMDAALRHRDTLRRVVLVSSQTVGGPSDMHGTPVRDDAPARPVTHYGRSKLAAEEVALAHKDDVPVTILRPSAVYGPRDKEVLIFFQSINNGVLPLTTPVHAKLSMIYGPDCARACIKALDADVPSGSTFFIDDGNPHTFGELIRETENALGKRAWLRIPLPRSIVRSAALATEMYGKVTNRAMMFTRDKCLELFEQWVCDSSRARQMLGWDPELSFEQGVHATAQWYKKAGWL